MVGLQGWLSGLMTVGSAVRLSRAAAVAYVSPINALELAAAPLSRPYCSMIKRGAHVPHPRHWYTLRRLIDDLVKSGTSIR